MMRGSEVFMKADLAAMLRGLSIATEAALQVGGGNSDYIAGQRATLLAIAAMLGIAPHEWQLRKE
jgi:hypothetical protein